MKEVVIAGGTGFIGSHLTKLFLENGYAVNILSRHEQESNTPNLKYYGWQPGKFVQQDIIDKATYVLNLAGANVGSKRWTTAYKKEILDSRVESTRTLVEAINRSNGRVEAFFCANAIGYYGPDKDKLLTETDPPGSDFMARVCVDWQNAAKLPDQSKTRLLIYRFGIILSPEEGAMKQMMLPIKFFAGAPLGSGRQIVPWIHIDDLCQMIIWGLENNKSRIYNATAPRPVTNKELTQLLAKELHKPLILPPVPGFMLKLILGEFAESVLASFPVSSQKAIRDGYQFQTAVADKAIADLISNK
jgi:uncharacterized protein (TIGR01777 family)